MKKYLAEMVGTFVLVFGGVGSAVLAGTHIGMPGVALPGIVDNLDGWQKVEYRDIRELPVATQPASAVPLLAIPYFAWANRGSGAMRVWIPDAG